MQRCPGCHHKFADDDCVCDLCGLSLEPVAEENGSVFVRPLLSPATPDMIQEEEYFPG
jgi:predicted amidophosphoribosyltransferase